MVSQVEQRRKGLVAAPRRLLDYYSMKGQGFEVFFPGVLLSAKPARRNKSWKRWSLRSGSKAGSTLRVVRIVKCSEYAFSRSARASSLSPIPKCAQSIVTG